MLDRSAGLSYMLARVNSGMFGSESYMTNFRKKLTRVLSSGIGSPTEKRERVNSYETTASTVKTAIVTGKHTTVHAGEHI